MPTVARRRPRPAQRPSGAQRRGGSARAPRQTFRPRPPQRFHRRWRGHVSLASVTRRRRGYRRFPGAAPCHGQPQLTQRSPARRCRPQASTASVVLVQGQEAAPPGAPPSRAASRQPLYGLLHPKIALEGLFLLELSKIGFGFMSVGSLDTLPVAPRGPGLAAFTPPGGPPTRSRPSWQKRRAFRLCNTPARENARSGSPLCPAAARQRTACEKS